MRVPMVVTTNKNLGLCREQNIMARTKLLI